MENGCILPNDLLQKIAKEGNIVLESLSHFCNCEKEELIKVLSLRNQPGEKENIPPQKQLDFGYRKYYIQTNKKQREIREPMQSLKNIQETIRQRLLCIPISLCCTANKPGDSAEKNANLHRNNPYLITMDIKNAYPSISTQRVYKNLSGALRHALKVWTPLLEEEDDKKLFIKALTHLCVSENELPQGASTSNQIQNIVMRGFDTKIEKRLPELSTSDIRYSRYADDITISFSQYTTMEVLKEKFESYENLLSGKGEEKEKNPDFIADILLDKFEKESFIATDKFERTYITQEIEKLKAQIKKSPITQEKRYEVIGQLNTYKQKIKGANRRIDNIKDELLKIIGQEGRTVNPKKIKTWTPQSDTEREINGITFSREGKRGISTKKQSAYLRLFSELGEKNWEKLSENNYWKRKFEEKDTGNPDKLKIQNTLLGCYNRLKQVYENEENIPKTLREAYSKAWKVRVLLERKASELGTNENTNNFNVPPFNSLIKDNENNSSYIDDDFPF